MDIVFPLAYYQSCDYNNEIRYCLRSLEKNLKFGFDVVIIGDKLPEFLVNVRFIQVDRWYPTDRTTLITYQNFFDTLNKLELVSMSDVSDKFIYCYDDMILTKPISLDFFDKAISYCRMEEFKEKGRWAQTFYKMAGMFRGRTGIKKIENYETHVPVMFDKETLRAMFKEYNFRKQKIPYSPISMYFNRLRAYPDIRLSEGNDIICYNEVDETKIWINYSDRGYQKIKLWIGQKFPKKSKYEK